MKRIDKIYFYLEENTKKLSKDGLLKGEGISAGDISDDLNILRNNVSKELNELLRMDKIIKIKGRPVKFFHKEVLENLLGFKLEGQSIEVDSIKDVIEDKENEEPFKLLIGAEKSLKNQVEQAKAAILYPPNGLHTLIVGQTGVGKTLFATMMYNYGKHVKRFSEKTPFIVFNCADYYNNPQLLLSHIFGHMKGSFTGADSEKDGLVEKANGGILFLDEIHRLPPEGQEMIFYFMDTGSYNKLGETERKRKANVLITGATTEDPESYMLKTFIRRIAIIINIPSLHQRTSEEKISMIKYLFSNEAHRVNKPIKISVEVVKALIGSVSYGNIGQLKSNIQLTCAKGFLNSINDNKGYIELDFKDLPANIKDGLFEIGKNRKELEEIEDILNTPLLVSPQGYKVLLEEDSYELPFNLYKLIEDKITILKEEGMDDNYIHKFITTDVNIHIKSLYNKFNKNKDIMDKDSRNKILKIVDKEIVELAEEAKDIAEKELQRRYSNRFIYALSLHLSSFFKRMKDKKYINKKIYDSTQDKDEERRVAVKITDLISERFKVNVPELEVTYIAILLKSVEEDNNGKVGILVAAHGNNTASSMVSVVENLLGSSSICAVDMPLDVSPKEILEVVIEKVKEVDSGRGVLLLVDMGSLFNFESTIVERTGIKVKTIDMVSTPLILEASRKSNIYDRDIEDIYNSLKEFRGYNNEINKNSNNNRVIVAVCASGKGTALRLKNIVEKSIFDLTEEKISVLPAGVNELDKKIKELQNKNKILAVVGVKRPKEDIPFIPLEKLIDGSGERILRELLLNNNFPVLNENQSIVLRDLCEDNLNEFLTYLNPGKITGLLMEFVKELEKEFDKEFDNTLKIRIIIHTAYALERMILKDGLTYGEDKNNLNKKVVEIVNKSCEIFKKSLNISLIDDEKYYICEILS